MTETQYQHSTDQNMQSLTFFQKLWLLLSIFLAATSSLNLFQISTDFSWSSDFEIFITLYKTVFHIPLDWMLGWINFRIPAWAKDVIIFWGSALFSLNTMHREVAGIGYFQLKNYNEFIRGVLNAQKEDDKWNLAAAIFYIIILFPITVLIIPALAPTLIFILLRIKTDGVKKQAKIYFKTFGFMVLLIITLMSFNLALLNIGAWQA